MSSTPAIGCQSSPAHLVRTNDGACSQRKNAANKLQHSGLATVVVYHIRHRVLHHIDSTQHVFLHPVFDALKGAATPLAAAPSLGLILRSSAAQRPFGEPAAITARCGERY
jgi:hypothetical protein